MTLREWLLLVHIVAAMVWVGGSVVLNVFASRALRGGNAQDIARFARDLRFVGPAVLAPSVLLVLGLGIWLVIEEAAWDFGQLWIVLGLILFGVAFLIGAIFLGRVAVRLDRTLKENGPGAPDAGALLRRWIVGSRLVIVILLVVTWDMVFKPGV